MIRFSKKTIMKVVGALIVVGLLAVGIFSLLDYLSWKNVTFTLSSNTTSAVIYYANYDEDGTSDAYKVTSIDSSSTIRLKTGSYVAVPSGEKVSSAQIEFTVKDDTSITIDPYYSESYLSSVFQGEVSNITTAVTAKYPAVTTDYVFGDGQFYHFGDWYATTLYNASPAPGEGVDIYGVILHKVDGKWVIATTPNIVFTYKDDAAVPRDIIDAANQLVNNL